jgi:glucokinase
MAIRAGVDCTSGHYRALGTRADGMMPGSERPTSREDPQVTDHPSVDHGLTVGVDIGGSKVLAGVVDAAGAVVERLRRATPSTSPAATEETIVEVVNELSSRHDVRAVGIGAAGYIDSSRSIVLFSPHLAWRNEPLRASVESRVPVPVLIDNDANAGAWAEWRFGAGRGEPFLACVNLGTGIGGGLVVDGQLVRGGYGLAAEFGHVVVVPGGHRCECGNRGCWEQYASGNALVREARDLAMSRSPVAQGLLTLVDGDPSAITGPVVTAAAMAGDPAAIELFGEVGTWLGLGLAGLAAVLDPTRFVIGGGVSAAGELLLGPARQAFHRSLTGRGYRPVAPVVAAALGNDAGFIGAADLAREVIGRAPGA